jgi:molybdenum cofactor biosynthesis protein MoaC
MISVSAKTTSLRRAKAVSVITATSEAINRMQKNDLPKKDVLTVARVAGVQAAKRTFDLIPFCHPMPIDWVDIQFEVAPDRVTIIAEVEVTWKTGVEMEALVAASVAALTIYDMLKPIDKNMEIVSTKLVSKTGGKSDRKENIPAGFKTAVLVTSDGTAQGKRQDKSGKLIQEKLESVGLTPIYQILPDDQDAIRAKLLQWCDDGVRLILTTGGTGLGPRDVTVEATRAIMEREVPGIMEAGRAYGQTRTPYAMLSRGLAAQRGKTLIINLPGSSNGVQETLAAIFPAVLHGYPMMEGRSH